MVKVRVSLASAAALGLVKVATSARPKTAYLMNFAPSGCVADCSFCAQAKSSSAPKDRLSRVKWPAFDLSAVVRAVAALKPARACLQTVLYEGYFDDVLEIVSSLSEHIEVSASIPPLTKSELCELESSGASTVGLGLDAASERVFLKVKRGPFTFSDYMASLRKAIQIFGQGKVSVHLIVGLGETDRELVTTASRALEMGAIPALFAFTPVPGTAMENTKPPPVKRYRRLQLALYLLRTGAIKLSQLKFDGDSLAPLNYLPIGDPQRLSEAFMTSGCPDCDRPFYNERPRGPLYNYHRPPSAFEAKKLLEEAMTP